MGYTTKFTGCIKLSRALTLKEAKELLEIADLDRAEAREITGTDAYLQWVPTETLDGIVWDGNEKFYEYVPLLRWLCGWLKERGIVVAPSLTPDSYTRGCATGKRILSCSSLSHPG